MSGDAFRLRVKFWGVRGSTPTPMAENLGFGGNTSCMEILSGDGQRIIIDAGSGIRRLGRQLIAENTGLDLHLFLTHFHWDHIQGLPFFAPLLQPGHRVTFHSFPPAERTRENLERQMKSPYFTLDFDAVGAAREYASTEGVFRHGAITVTSFPLYHPQGAHGYRVEAHGAAVIIATDVEHGEKSLDRLLREKADGADVLIYDAQYTPEEYAVRRGWGHSTYAEAAAVARDSGVKKLVLFHHDPLHDDQQMAGIVRQACSLFAETSGACEAQTVTVV